MSAAAATSRADRLFLADAKANVNCASSRLRDIVEDDIYSDDDIIEHKIKHQLAFQRKLNITNFYLERSSIICYDIFTVTQLRYN